MVDLFGFESGQDGHRAREHGDNLSIPVDGRVGFHCFS
jgi:hypothetical protein